MTEINIEVVPESEEPAEETTAVDVSEVEAIVADAIEDAKTEQALEVAEDKIQQLETIVRALDEKVQDLEEVVIDIEQDILEDDIKDAANDLEHAIIENQVEALQTEEVAETAAEEVLEDVNPPHADQHILFAPSSTVWTKFKDWYNG